MKKVFYVAQLTFALFILEIYYFMFLWQAPDFMGPSDWREHTIFTKQGAETASILDQGVYVAEH